MQRQSQRHYTVEDYFSIEESSTIKHEFYDGEIFAMTGASLNHNRIARNMLAALNATLRNTPCEAFPGDVRLRTPSGLYTYPDVMVICGPIELSTDRLETVTNPSVLVEVLSDSTCDYDRGDKFTLYRAIPTFLDYMLIEQAMVKVEHWYLTGEGEWAMRQYNSLDDQLRLSAVDCSMLLSVIYDRVEFLK